MLNGKFFSGLPANMVERRSTAQNRQETHFFWPDDTQSESTVDSRTKRRSNSIQAESRSAYNNSPRGGGEQSNSDAETKERFKKEFTRSSIQFYDSENATTPVRRNRKPLTVPPQKLQNVQPPESTLAKRKENLTSKIEFNDYATQAAAAPVEDLNNVPKTNKNNKAELERNTKNSPKLQNKNLSFNPPADDAINFIENNVRDMRIVAPPRRRNKYERPPNFCLEDQIYSDAHDDYIPPRSRPQPPPPLRGRYSAVESDPDYDDYMPRRSHSRPPYNPREPLDYIQDDDDGHPSSRRNYYDPVPLRKRAPRQVQYTPSAAYACNNDYNSNYEESPSAITPPTPSRRLVQNLTAQQKKTVAGKKWNISKVDNDTRNNNEQRQMMIPPTQAPPVSPSSPQQHHLRSNICFSDTESASSPVPSAQGSSSSGPPPTTTKRNIRSSAVNRVSVGLPD